MATVTVQNPAATATTRMLSLDVLRGVTIAFMIMVNNNGAQAYWPFEHARWNGFTPTDLVFPTFLFLVGVTIVFSTESRLKRGATEGSLVPHIVRRFLILIFLGIFAVNGFPHFPWASLRIYGVLQRIAVCYLIGSLLYLWDRRPASKVAILVTALVGYWVLLRWVPVPGLGMPGHDIPFMDKDANLVAWLDRHIFPGRLYEGTRDPEGMLSNLPALGTLLLGMLTAIWLRTSRTLERKCAGLLGAGLVLIVLGALWNPWFPINKKLWTSSYVLFAGGLSMVLWALFIWLIEIKGWKKGWTFWLVFGMNAIGAYVLSEMLSSAIGEFHVRLGLSAEAWIYAHVFAPIHPPGVASLLYSIAFVLACWLPMLVLYRMKIFLKV
ncbi:MAG TPA: heparan-alpha-glucosaminide N-acetyltransferase domain-containing protein [Acidobacteriaceae bacterium]|jgi:predicted acyltransferase